MYKKLLALDRKALTFIGLFFGLVLLLNVVIAWSWVDSNIILPYTEAITGFSGQVLNLIGYPVTRTSTILRSDNFAVDIRRGCDGVVATVLLISACLAYPSNFRQKLFGAAAGYGLIFFLNLLRIIVLFILGDEGAMEMFDFVHTYVAQFAVIALTMVFWVYWAGRQKPLYQ